jgi:hypothetical protein
MSDILLWSESGIKDLAKSLTLVAAKAKTRVTPKKKIPSLLKGFCIQFKPLLLRSM